MWNFQRCLARRIAKTTCCLLLNCLYLRRAWLKVFLRNRARADLICEQTNTLLKSWRTKRKYRKSLRFEPLSTASNAFFEVSQATPRHSTALAPRWAVFRSSLVIPKFVGSDAYGHTYPMLKTLLLCRLGCQLSQSGTSVVVLYSVRRAADGLEPLRRIRSHPPSVS